MTLDAKRGLNIITFLKDKRRFFGKFFMQKELAVK
jgi:hypothetical protein